jgi:predicted nuclease of predicted toxin-antitoxin system
MLPAYADENLKQGVIEGLRRRGMDLVTAEDRGQRATEDDVLLATATAERRLLLTNDADFLRIHSEWMTAGRHHAVIVFWAQERPVGEVIRRVLRYARQSTADVVADTVKYL